MELLLCSLYGIAAAFPCFGLVVGLNAIPWKLPNWAPINCAFCLCVWFGCVMLLVHHVGNIVAYGSLIGAAAILVTSHPLLFQDTSKKESVVDDLANPLLGEAEPSTNRFQRRALSAAGSDLPIPLDEGQIPAAARSQLHLGSPEDSPDRAVASSILRSQCCGAEEAGLCNDVGHGQHVRMVESAR